MTSQRWNEIDRVFAAALELEPSEQAAFLDQACAGDQELRQEVESLLAHDLAESLVRGESGAEATRLFSKALGAELKDKVIGPYQIIRELGTGGMGCVYLAHDQRLNRPVAVKLLSNYNMAAAERLRRFRQEALAASALNHPNILTIYEIGEAEGKNFIATEFVDGSTLSKRIDAGPLAVTESLDLGIQIASALSAAHAAGIIHRDIKPANVMVRIDGFVKVLDFGIAKYVQANNDNASGASVVETAPGAVMGTAAYMSPEQARGASVDARTDLWSLGAMLYEMVSGSRPFLGDTAIDVMAAVIERQPLPFSTYLAVPDSLEAIVFKALQKNRDARYQTANELLTDLKELAKKLEFASHNDGRSAVNEARQEAVRGQISSSIAVLPFVNMSADAENEYFCDGLSEELLNALTRIEDLKVAARTSTFSFKGKDVTVSGIGRALNVNSVLEGSVRKSGNRLRITVQLVNAADGYHLWSERYDREMKDIFDVQDEIALAVVDALRVKLLGKEKVAVLKRYTENVEAYQLYLKGRYYWWKTAPEEFAKGRDYFEQAVAVDPSYGLSYCGLSSYFGFGSAWGIVPPDVGWPKAVAANARALELDDTLAEVHNNMAGVNMVYRRDPLAAEKSITRHRAQS
jgi:serine/threonine protein kinase